MNDVPVTSVPPNVTEMFGPNAYWLHAFTQQARAV